MTHDRNRDAAVERLLREGLPVEPTPGACLDAEVLAAWADGELDAVRRQAAEAHASRCARCQATLAAMVRSADGAAGPAEAGAGRRGFRDSLRWLVPLAGGALAASLWLAVRPGSEPAAPSDTVTLEQPAARQVDAVRPPEPAREAASSLGSDARADERLSRTEATNKAEGTSQPTPGERRQQAVGQERDRLVTVTADTQAKAQGAATKLEGMAAKPESTPVGAVAAPRAIIPPGVPAELPPAPPPTPPPSLQARAAGRGERAEAEPVSALRFDSAIVVVISSVDSSSRWRFAAGRRVEHSTDAGKTWTEQTVPPDLVLLAGSSPSVSVCWIVGRGGAVLLTTDATTWQSVPIPERVDLTAVNATDARSATVRTADGRTFRTADGGRTWNKE
ncbi:MAG TPA: YCF48-related protein [Vicinamibacterales bacterium]|nr:YCF48-related protein [Vicinamibacterales bacterium]